MVHHVGEPTCADLLTPYKTDLLNMKNSDKIYCSNPANLGFFVGYIRISSSNNNIKVQQDALIEAGCVQIYVEIAKRNSNMNRHELRDICNKLRSGDTFVVSQLDRVTQSPVGLIKFIIELGEKGIGFKSLLERINLSWPENRNFMSVFLAVSPFVAKHDETDTWEKLKIERTQRKGRNREPLDNYARIEIQRALHGPSISPSIIASHFNADVSTVYLELINEAQKCYRNIP